VLREETVAKYPYWATRELLMNAIMHRDYQTNAPVLFYEYDDRIEIQNSGGLYGKVSEDNFPNVSDYRNPFIAEAMKILGYVNRFSRGVYRVQKELVENGNGEAMFDFSLITAFKVVENVSKRYFEAGFGADESEYAGETPEKRHINTGETPGNLNDTIINIIQNEPKISMPELATRLSRTPDSIRHHIRKLTEQGIIKHVGSTKAGEWVILKK
jgi:ATP-dependent DNA helicase RecG